MRKWQAVSGRVKVLETDLALAHETQEGLLPHSLPNEGHLRIQAFSKPTRHVGGDFYDFLHTESGEFVSILVHVSGKGVAASLLSSMILGFIHAHLRIRIDSGPDHRCTQSIHVERSSGGFATMFVCILDEEGNGRFISAGHNPAYLFRPAKGDIEEFSSNSTIVGAFQTAQYEASLFKLDVGDVLLVYSDGLTDAEIQKAHAWRGTNTSIILTESAGGAAHLKQTFRNIARFHAWSESKRRHNHRDNRTRLSSITKPPPRSRDLGT